MFFNILILNWALSIIFIFINHPISLGGILLMQAALMSAMLGYFYVNFWFSYTLFLITIGGILVMFIYMTSIASNEKFSIPKNFIKMSITATSIELILFFNDKFLTELPKHPTNSLYQAMKSPTNIVLSKFFNYPSTQMMSLLMIYLFITLIAVVKLSKLPFSAIRQK